MKQNSDKKLFLLDAMALIYRAYYGLGGNFLYNSKGMNTTAISVFTDSLMKLLSKENPTHIAIAFDLPGPTQRDTEYEFYKANREEMPEDIKSSIPHIKEILEAFDIPILEFEGYEADDIIGTLAKKAEKDGYEVYMVTPDKDFGQLVSENIYMYKPPFQGKQEEIYGIPEILKKWEINDVNQVIDLLGLMGDKVDNIPGIPGVGEKTAIKLLKEFGSVENLIKNTDQLKGKLKEKVEQHAGDAILSKKLATIITDLPIEVEEEKLVMSKPDKEKLAKIFADLEFRSLGKRLLGNDFSVNKEGQMDLFGGSGVSASNGDNSKELKGGKNIHNTRHDYYLVKTDGERKDLIDTLAKLTSFCFDTETTSTDPNNCEIVGISFSFKPGEGYYVPLPEEFGDAKKILAEFKYVMENKNILKIGQNVKYDMLVLKWYEIEVKGPLFDTMLAHYLIDTDTRHKLDIMAENYLGYSPITYDSLIEGQGRKKLHIRDVELEKIKEYAVEDADITLQLKETFEPVLKEKKFEKLFNEVEIPLVSVLADMEYEGVMLDKEFLQAYSKEMEKDIQDVQEAIYAESNAVFNIDSPKQLGDILFNQLHIPYEGKKTKTGQYSTGEEVLTRLSREYPIARKITDYRELVKLKSTYVDALPLLVNPKSQRIHSSFNQAVAATGRLSSANPNLQNIPIKTERGRKIRKAFIPRNSDYQILSADYSQIELRLVADISKDEAMMRAFRDGLDIHTATASKVYGVSLDMVTREMRGNAKMVNFGIIYGISAFGLSQRAAIPKSDAALIIEQYFRQYPGIKKYMDESIKFARQHGYVETLMGRRRYLKDINSRNATVRGFAERNAINSPVQGSAADMIKVAMIRIHHELSNRKLRSKMTLQVHDELVFDVHKEEIDQIKPIVEDCMKHALELEVPIVVEMGIGDNWLQAH